MPGSNSSCIFTVGPNVSKAKPSIYENNGIAANVDTGFIAMNEKTYQSADQRLPLGSIGSSLERFDYSKQFASLYLIPMVAAPRCIEPTELSRNFPAKFLIELITKISSLEGMADGMVGICTEGGEMSQFDHVALAVHAPQALQILSVGASRQKREILGAFKTSQTVCVLHIGTEMLPRRESARSSWNCLLKETFHTRETEEKISD
ncbi:hypothetical protein DM02DRAFT_629027 [Periconia macrospinosa]|uniref:Uncharacterized protein n=1 Tax=Periconia macrospinosa TaxID=97972 RepID=A0A2V1DR68_9PLEO|nr:hypothetical protein DM02DRAFT_629027 [Periconia macrospinosa]